ncbi:TPA: hypothetical protein ACU17S_002650, partial [Staphylococcus aureus]
MNYEKILMYSPSSDYNNSDVVGNIIYKDSLLNNVSSIPVLKQQLDEKDYPPQYTDNTDNDIDSYKAVLLTDPTNFDGIESTIDLSIYFKRNEGELNSGYNKLLKGIENQEIVKFNEDDFVHTGSFSHYDIAKEFTNFLRDTEFQYDIPKKALDQAQIKEKNLDYNVRYSKNDEHIYINDFPCIPVEN